jgi:hypothetical protein
MCKKFIETLFKSFHETNTKARSNTSSALNIYVVENVLQPAIKMTNKRDMHPNMN